MAIVRNNATSDAGRGQSGPASTGSNFTNLYDLINDADRQANGDRYEWMSRATPQSDEQRSQLRQINEDRDRDEEERELPGRRNWDQTSEQELNGFDKIAAGFASWGDQLQVSSENDFGSNLVAATFGSLMSPVTAGASAIGNFYEFATGKPITEASEDLSSMPDYELDSNEKAASLANGVIDVAGLAFGGSKDWIQSMGRGVRYGAAMASGRADDAAKIAQGAAEALPTNATDALKRIGGSMLEEGVEEAVQSGISDVRYDQFDDGSLGRALESGAWGAAGGAVMTVASMAVNSALSGGSKANEKGANTDPSNTNVSSDTPYDMWSTPATTYRRADTDVQQRIEERQNADKFVPGGTNYKVVQGTPDLRPTDVAVGSRGLYKMFFRDDQSQSYFVDAVRKSGYDPNYTVEKARQLFESGNDGLISTEINKMIDSGARFRVYAKREPHTDRDSVMAFDLVRVNPGNTIMTNTMVPQMNGGDVDGDTMGFLVNPDAVKAALYPTAGIMDQRPLPGGRYGKVHPDSKFIGFSLDSDLMNKSEWRNHVGVDPISAAFDSALSGVGLTYNDGTDRTQQWIAEWRDRLVRAWNSDDGFDEFALQYMNMREDLIRSLSRKGVEDAADLVDSRYLSDLIWNLQNNTRGYLTFKGFREASNQETVESVVRVAQANPADVGEVRGTTGQYTRATTVFSAIDVIQQMFSVGGATGLRFQQNMFWNATSSRTLSDAMVSLPSPEAFETFVGNMMHLFSSDATPLREMNKFFKAYVAQDVFRRRGSIADSRIGGGLDVDRFLEDFRSSYNHYVSLYNRALVNEGIEGPYKAIGDIDKKSIEGRRSLFQAFNDVFDTFDASDIMAYDDGMPHTWGDLLYQASRGDGSVDVFDYLGEDANGFFREAAAAFGAQEASRGSKAEDMVRGIKRDFNISWDADGKVVIDDANRQFAVQYWQFMKQAIGIDACSTFGLVNFDSAANSAWGQKIFSVDPSDRLQVALQIRVANKYRDYIWNKRQEQVATRKAEEAKTDADRKNAEADARRYSDQAIAHAKLNYGNGFLDNYIVANIVNDGNDNFLMNILGDDLTYEQKADWFDKMQSQAGFLLSKENLFESATRTQDSQLTGSDFSNELTEMKRAYDLCGRNTMAAARRVKDGIVDLIRNSNYETDRVIDAMLHVMRNSSQRINSNLMATLYFDAADVVKGHVDKGSSTPTEVEVNQMMAKIFEGGASSAMNRITGSTLATSTIVSASRNKQFILDALSDPDHWHQITFDGQGYTTVTQRSIFESVGIKLSGAPTATDWIALLDAYPTIATWIGDTTFNQVPGTNTVTEVRTVDPVAEIRRYIEGGDASVRSRELNAIRNRILSDPNNSRIILGVMGANNPGDQFSRVLESPERWLSEWERAVSQVVSYEHARLAAGQPETMASNLRITANDIVYEQTADLVNKAERVARLMQRAFSVDTGTLVRPVLKDLMRNRFVKSMVSQMGANNFSGGSVDVATSTDVTSQVKAAAESGVATTKAEAELRLVLGAITGRSIEGYASFGVLDDPSLADTQARLRDIWDEDAAGKSFDDAWDEAYTAVIGSGNAMVPFVQVPDFATNIVTASESTVAAVLAEEGGDEMARKISDIKSSGKYGVFDRDSFEDVKKELVEIATTEGQQGLDRVRDRYNGLVLQRAVENVAGVHSTESNRGYYSATIEAYDQINKMSDDLASEENIHVSTSRSDVRAPRLDFRNRTLSVLADFTVSALEGSGNALMSGVEGGEYQQLVSLAGYNGGIHTDQSPRLVRVGDIRADIEGGGTRYLGCRYDRIPIDDFIASGDRSKLVPPDPGDFSRNFRLSSLRMGGQVVDDDSWLWVYPLDDAPYPDMEHMREAVVRNGQRFDYLTDLLISIVYDRSEPGVFKRKKTVGLFDNVSRRIHRDVELAKGAIARPDPRSAVPANEQVVEEVREYRRRLADHYFDEFVEEKMDKEFGPYDASLLAQLTTPIIEVTTGDATTILSMDQVWSAEKYAAAGVDLTTADSIRIVPLSLDEICAKVRRDMASVTSDFYESGETMVTSRQLTEATKRAMQDWSHYRNMGTDGVAEMMSIVPALSSGSPINVTTARSAYSPARFLAAADGTSRGVVSQPARQAVDAITLSTEEMDNVRRANEIIWGENSDRGESGEIQVYFADVRDKSGGILDNSVINRVARLNLRRTPALVRADNASGVPYYLVAYGNDTSAYASAYRAAAGGDVVVAKMLVPEDVVNMGVIPDSAFTDKPVRIGGDFFRVVDPSRDARPDRYLGPVPDFMPVSPRDIEFAIGVPTISDSATLFSPEDSNKRRPESGPVALSRDVLFPGIRRASIVMPDGVDDLSSFRRAWEHRNDEGQRSLSVPKFPAGNTAMSEAEIEAAVNRYLDVADRLVGKRGNPCFVDENVELGDCIGFVKTWSDAAGPVGDWVYSPVILNKGGIPAHIDRIYCGVDRANADVLQLWISGELTATDVDGIKVIFPDFAYKSYGRYATQDEWSLVVPKLGMSITNGSDTAHVNIAYASNTEDSRLIDRGMSTLRANLYNGLMKKGGGLFWVVDENGDAHLDYESAMSMGISPVDLRDLMNQHRFSPLWNKVIDGSLALHTDPNVNMAIRKVAFAIRNANMSPGHSGTTISPASALSTFSLEPDGSVTYFARMTEKPDFIFGEINDADALLKLFHTLSDNFCPNGYTDDDSNQYLFDKRGRILVDDGNGNKYYAPGHVMLPRLKHDSSMQGIAASRAALGNQQYINRAMERGFAGGQEIEKAVQLMQIANGNYTPYLIGGRYYKEATLDSNPWRDETIKNSMSMLNELDFSYQEAVRRQGQSTFNKRLTVVDNKFDKNVISSNDPELMAIYSRLTGREGFDFDVKVDPLLLHNLFKMQTGWSYNDGDGSTTVTIDQFRKAVDEIVYNLNHSDGYFIKGGIVNNRYTIPLMPRPMMRFVYEHSRKLKSRGNLDSYDAFVSAALEELDHTRDAVGAIRVGRADQRARKKALETIIEYCYESNGQGFRGPSLVGYYSMDDLMQAQNPLYRNLAAAEPDTAALYFERQGERKEWLQHLKESRDADKYNRIESPMAPNGFVASWFGTGRNWYDYVFRNAMTLSRTMSMMAMPTMPASAFLARAKGAGMTKAMLFLQNRGRMVIRDQHNLHLAAKGQDAKKVWQAFNEIQMNSDEADALVNISTPEALDEYLKSIRQRGGRLGKFSRAIFKIGTADGAFTSWQIENYVNGFAQSLDPDRSPWWFEEVDGTGKTRLEYRVETDLAGFLVETLTSRTTSDDLITARSARNLALQCDMAQQTSVGLILNEIFRKHSVAEFLVATNFLKFPNYVINSSGWFLNHVAPVSSLYRWATSKLIQKAKSENPRFLGVDLSTIDLESTQIHSSFKEAAYADAMSIGVGGLVALLLSGVLNFEPPKNEDGTTNWALAGNLNEWTILGMRIDEPWWLQDVMGPALAIAAFAESASMGEPRFDLVTNWLGQAMWNNPVLRACDVLSAIFEPDQGYVDGMIEESQLYADAKGGSPSLMEMWQTGLLTYGMNWASQFVTPSFVKELYRNSREYEHSYKRTYVTDENGNIVYDKNGMPYTTETTYADAQMRRLARNNPFAALVLSTVSGGLLGDNPNDSYFWWDMPRTVYYRTDQLAAVNYYSIYTTDENGNQVPKSAEEINSVAYDVIATLAATDDMYELAESGWVIPYETREYVSKLLWDNVHYLDMTWSNWVESEAYDFTVLGDGDFGAGRQMYEEAKQAYKTDRENLTDIYNKLWDDALGGMEQYNSFNTTYQTDAYGNYYATGFRPGTFFNAAAGSVDDAGPTMGQLGNWETPTISNPDVSTGRRALVGIDQQYESTPAISSWSSDGGGDDYSDMSQLTVGALVNNEYGSSSSSTRPDYSTYYGGSRQYYSRGGGSRGGSGYSPSIYSRLPNVYLPSARTMYSERIYGPNYDYLRPNFETKGSREAYKRSDI